MSTRNEEKGKVGRPPIIVRLEEDLTIDVHSKIAKKYKDMIPRGDLRSGIWKELLEFAILARYGDPEERALNVLREETSLAEAEYHEKKARLMRAEEVYAEKKRLREKGLEEKAYLAKAFRVIVQKSEARKQVRMNPEWIKEGYGISFDIEAVNRDFDSALEALEAPDSILIEKFRVRRIAMGEKEKEIKATLVAEVNR